MYNTGSRFRFEFAQKYGILLRVLLDKEKFKDCATKYMAQSHNKTDFIPKLEV